MLPSLQRLPAAPTGVGGFSMNDDGVRYDGGRFFAMPQERTPEEERLVLERMLEMANQEIEYIIATGQAYEALNARYGEIANNNGGQMSDQLGNRWSYHMEEISRLAARLPNARLDKAKAEAKLSRMMHGMPLQ